MEGYSTVLECILDGIKYERITKYQNDNKINSEHEHSRISFIRNNFKEIHETYVNTVSCKAVERDGFTITNVSNFKNLVIAYYRNENFLEGITIFIKDNRYFNVGKIRK